ncbi:MAG: helix-turn-helix transcriptional regulator [Solidesulfovibrio sp. DCME]|uniref:helix-turn-helix transcriptional regulator n=1 Tax=Solidesulfovibrio sp. DCME TaxID=3447380 RepID=UPI003D0D2962
MTQAKKRQYRHLPAFILLALAQGPLHGGGLRGMFASQGLELAVDSAAVYRTLRQLEAEGAVTSAWDASRAGPALRVYSLTAAGHDKLDAWKADIEHRLALLTNFLHAYDRLPPRGPAS